MDVESLTRQIGRRLLADARAHRSGVFSARFWTDQLMDWAMKDAVYQQRYLELVNTLVVGDPLAPSTAWPRRRSSAPCCR